MKKDSSNKFNKIMRVLGIITGWFLCFWLVQLLWNWIAVSLFGLPVITYWEAFGLVWLVNILLRNGISINFKKKLDN